MNIVSKSAILDGINGSDIERKIVSFALKLGELGVSQFPRK